MKLPQNPYVFHLGRIVKQSLTKKSRTDLNRAMIAMCSLTGWQSTALNPDLDTADKLAILSAHFGKITTVTHVAPDRDVKTDIITGKFEDVEALYAELISLAAVTMGWAQGIARRELRDRKRRSREQKLARKQARKEVETVKTTRT